MRRQFERKMVQRKMDRRREMEEVQLGVKQEVLYGRKAKANLHQGTFHERQAKMLRMHLQAEQRLQQTNVSKASTTNAAGDATSRPPTTLDGSEAVAQASEFRGNPACAHQLKRQHANRVDSQPCG